MVLFLLLAGRILSAGVGEVRGSWTFKICFLGWVRGFVAARWSIGAFCR